MDAALAATDCSKAEATAGLGEAAAAVPISGGGVSTPVEVLPPNMASIVGRKAAPNGVDRKSDGRSGRMGCYDIRSNAKKESIPLI